MLPAGLCVQEMNHYLTLGLSPFPKQNISYSQHGSSIHGMFPFPTEVLCVLSPVRLCNPTDCVARQAPLSRASPTQQHWSGLSLPSPEGLPDPGIEEAVSLDSLCIGRWVTTNAIWEALEIPFPFLLNCCPQKVR